MGMGANFRMPAVIQKVMAKHLTLLALLAENPYFMRVSRLLESNLSSHYNPTLIHRTVVPQSTSTVRFDAVHDGRMRNPNSRVGMT